MDGSFGFSLKVPAGSIIQREKKLVGQGDVEIVRFIQPDLAWSLVVRLSKVDRPLSTDLLMEEITRGNRNPAPGRQADPERSSPVRRPRGCPI